MKEKYLSHPYVLMIKYGVFIFFTCISIIGGLILIFKNLEILGGLIFIAFGILVFTIVRNLKEISFTTKKLIIKDLNSKEYVELYNVKRLYKISTGTFYRIEYSVDEKIKSADIWPKFNFFLATKGNLPVNFQEFLDLIE